MARLRPNRQWLDDAAQNGGIKLTYDTVEYTITVEKTVTDDASTIPEDMSASEIVEAILDD